MYKLCLIIIGAKSTNEKELYNYLYEEEKEDLHSNFWECFQPSEYNRHHCAGSSEAQDREEDVLSNISFSVGANNIKWLSKANQSLVHKIINVDKFMTNSMGFF